MFCNNNVINFKSKNGIGKFNIFNEDGIKQIKSKDAFEKLRINFIFKRIFECMKKYKKFEIIKYNKRLQNRLNLN